MKRRFMWKKEYSQEVNKVALEFTPGEFWNQYNVERDPIEFYKRFNNNELLEKIVDESNKYAT